MFIHLNPNSGMPIYRQLFQQLRQRIVSGQLAVNEQLPSVRDLSAELKINSSPWPRFTNSSRARAWRKHGVASAHCRGRE